MVRQATDLVQYVFDYRKSKSVSVYACACVCLFSITLLNSHSLTLANNHDESQFALFCMYYTAASYNTFFIWFGVLVLSTSLNNPA